jgi:hypothetical protein
MTFYYEKLESDLEEACQNVHNDFLKKFGKTKSYVSVGGAKLEAFIDGIQREFESAAIEFLTRHNLMADSEAKRRALNITKLYAKRCVEDYSRVN